MINPTEKDIGRSVIYRRDGDEGVITSFNDHMVFVRYGGAQGSMATRREDLNWSNGFKVVADTCRSPVLFSKATPMHDDEEERI